MKRSKMLIRLQRLYGIRHCMVEQRYITVEQFCDEMLSLMEQDGMLPPKVKVTNLYEYSEDWVSGWEQEEEDEKNKALDEMVKEGEQLKLYDNDFKDEDGDEKK